MIRIICLTLLLAVSYSSSLQAVTRYVAKPGTSVSGAWAGHWTTISQVNSGTNPGDTVFFGTGIWRGVQLVVVGGSPGAPTVYACSSFANVNGNGEYHFARIYASNEVTGWTSIGGGVYSHSGSVSGPLFEGQTLLMKSSSTSLGQGQWWTGGGETRVRLTSDRNPTSGTSIETSSGGAGTTILLDSQDYVTIWGLDVRYGNNRNIAASYLSGATNFITIENCKVGPCAGNFSSNPGNIYSGTTSGLHNDWVIRACSLGATYALNGNSVVGTHGASLEFYSQNRLTVEGCFIYGFHSLGAIYHKNDNGLSTYGNIYRYNEIKTDDPGATMLRFYRGKRDVEVYGNLFLNHAGTAIMEGPSNSGDGNHSIYNNTFINVDEPFSTCHYEGSTRKIDLRFKYNVIYHTGTSDINLTSADLGNPSGPTVIDNNLYFTNSAAFSTGGCAGQTYTNWGFSGWQSKGWDVNSTLLPASSQDFTNLAGGSYDRQSSPTEMDTVYGGQRWQWYGAIQVATVDTTPHLALSTGNLNFIAEEAAALPASQTFNITNTGINTLNWSVSDNASWLDVSPTSGSSNSATITASINSTSLAVGTYNAVITVGSSNADNGPLTLSVTYIVTTSIPRISLNQSSLNYTAVLDGSIPGAKTIAISNIGGGTLNWSVSVDAVWLDLWPLSGIGNSDTVTATINSTALPVGTYPAIITFTSSNADNSPQTVSVNYTVSLTVVGISLLGNWNTGLTHTMLAGTDRLLVFAVGWEEQGTASDRPLGGVSYGNIPMTRIVRNVQPSFQGVELWYLNEADIQSATNSTFSVNWSTGPPGVVIHYSSGLCEGVNQSSPIYNTSVAGSPNAVPNPLTATLDVVTSGYSIAVASHGNGSNGLIWNNGWTTQSNQTDASATTGTGTHSDSAGGTATVSVTEVNGTSNRFVLAAASLSPSNSGPPPPPDTIPPAPVLDLGWLPGILFGPGSFIQLLSGHNESQIQIGRYLFDPPYRQDPPPDDYVAIRARSI